jgi:hypothetical protein
MKKFMTNIDTYVDKYKIDFNKEKGKFFRYISMCIRINFNPMKQLKIFHIYANSIENGIAEKKDCRKSMVCFYGSFSDDVHC